MLVMDSKAALFNRSAVQILLLLTVTEVTAGITTGTALLTISLTLYHQLPFQFIQDFQ